MFKNFHKCLILIFSSETDEVRAKRESSLCNESVNGHFWSNLCLNCIFKRTWFVKRDIWSGFDSWSWEHWHFSLFSPFFDSVPSLFHSNSQSLQIRNLPTLDTYIIYIWKHIFSGFRNHPNFYLMAHPNSVIAFLNQRSSHRPQSKWDFLE